MSDLGDLYQEVILEHSKTPRNYRVLASANRKAEGFNPLCGDRYIVYIDMDGDQIREISFEGTGCAISKASASMMTQSVKGRSSAETETLFESFRRLVTGTTDGAPELGKLQVFSGVSEYPTRVKCATLPWHTLRAAMKGERETVSTE
jgi:nitrogen fixation protein NifU and related proteins